MQFLGWFLYNGNIARLKVNCFNSLFFIPDVLKHRKRTIDTWIIIRSSHRRRSEKNGALKDSCSESNHVKFAVKSLEKYLYRTSSLVKLQAFSEQLY